MIGYTTVGTADMARSEAFYNQLFEAMGYKQLMKMDRLIAWGDGAGPMFCVCTPYDGEEMHSGNGTMIALAATSRDQVHELYALARELGASDEGEPGMRMEPFYCGYVRDLDGNKLNFYCTQ